MSRIKWLIIAMIIIGGVKLVMAVDISTEYLDNNTVFHMWNPQYDFYFNETSGIQLTNHYNEYWTHNTFCGGRYTGSEWLDFCTDNIPFTWTSSTDNETYAQYEGVYEITYQGKTIIYTLTYYLELDDTELDINMKFESQEKKAITDPLRMIWKINDIKINMMEENNSYLINNTWLYAKNLTNPSYDINISETLSYKNLTDTTFYARLDNTQEYLYLKWDNTTNSDIILTHDSGEYNAPIALYITKEEGLEAYETYETSMQWIDALDTSLEHNEDATTPVTDTYTFGDGTTLIVLSIITKGTTRVGGAPTYDGVELTLANATGDVGEGAAEIWYLTDFTGLSHSTGYTMSVPNTDTDETSFVISSFIAEAGNIHEYVTSNIASAISTNPTVSVTNVAAGDVIVDVMFSGYKDVASGNNRVLLYTRDTGGEGYGVQYNITNSVESYAMSWTQSSDDWGMVAGVWTEILAPTITQNVTNQTVFADTTPTLNFTGSGEEEYNMTYQIQIDNQVGYDSNSIAGNSVGILDNVTSAAAASGSTRVSLLNPIDESELIISAVYIRASNTLSDVKIGSFYGSGTTYTNRDYESIGSVSAGGELITSLNIDTEIGDFIGIYYTGIGININTSTTTGHYHLSGDHFDDGAQTYTLITTQELELLGFTINPAPIIDNVSATEGGFTGTPDSTDPFVSNQLVSYTVQDVLAEDMYYWRVRTDYGDDKSVGWTDWSETRLFNVTTAISDPPVISGVVNDSITNESILINWTTDLVSNTSVLYGITSSLGSITSTDDSVTSHVQSVTGLTNNTLYYFNVTSCNVIGCDTEGSYTFWTLNTSSDTCIYGGTGDFNMTENCNISIAYDFNGSSFYLATDKVLRLNATWGNTTYIPYASTGVFLRSDGGLFT